MSYFIVPRTWKKVATNTPIYTKYHEICQKAIELKLIKSEPDLYWFHSTVAWGRAHFRRCFDGYVSAVGLNEVFKDEPVEKAIETLCHEIAHVATPGEGHSCVWSRAFYKLGGCFSVTHYARCTSQATMGIVMPKVPETEYHYALYCPHCKRVVSRKYKTYCDKIRRASRWVHSSCGTSCVPVELNPDGTIKRFL